VAVPTGWTDDGTYLTAPNGRRVVLGFRWHILTHSWAADDWPIESEHYESVLDLTNPLHGDGIVQHFRRSILAWKEDSSQVLVLWSGAVALAWQRQAQSVQYPAGHAEPAAVAVPAVPAGTYSGDRGPVRGEESETTTSRPFAGVGLGIPHGSISATPEQLPVSTKPADVWLKRFASREKQLPKLLFSNQSLLLGWLIMLIALLGCDLVVWLVSAHFERHTTFPLPLLALGTVLLSSFFLLLSIVSPRR
jgi:hypothetical protein